MPVPAGVSVLQLAPGEQERFEREARERLLRPTVNSES
jgi:hypothetical protein